MDNKIPRLQDIIGNTTTLVVVPKVDKEEDKGIVLKAGDKLIVGDNTMYLLSYIGTKEGTNKLRAINIETGKLSVSGDSREIIRHFKNHLYEGEKLYLCKQVVIETTHVEEIK